MLMVELQLQMLCGWLPGEGQRTWEAQKEHDSPSLEWMSYWRDSGEREVTVERFTHREKKREKIEKERQECKLYGKSGHCGERETR